MQGTKFAPWELRSWALSSRATALDEAAADEGAPLTPGERKTLKQVAEKLRVHAREVVRRR